MNQYRLPCTKDDCGGSTIVDVSQAGLTVPCAKCGTSLEVPTIRGLAQLERVVTEDPEQAQRKWGVPQSLMTIGAVMLVGFLALAFWLLAMSPPPPGGGEYEAPKTLTVESSFGEIYQAWNEVQRGLRYIDNFEIREYRRRMEARTYWGIAALVIAGLGGVVIGVGWSMRQGPTEPPARKQPTPAASTSAK
jgi:ribosomal protein S27E